MVCKIGSKFEDHYSVNQVIGSGGYGSVCEVVHRKSGEARAAKSSSDGASKKRGDLGAEAAILLRLDHPHIVKLIEGFEDPSQREACLVLELCEGGELYNKVLDSPTFDERAAAYTLRQLFSAVGHMHDRFVCHRDLKPSNLMFVHKGPIMENTLKVVDFGLATTFVPGQPIRRAAGTAPFCAPEVYERRYSAECDLWSVGCILFLLMTGALPFVGHSTAEIKAKAGTRMCATSGKQWEGVSEEARALTFELLELDVKRRCTAAAALQHAWLAKSLHAEQGAGEASPEGGAADRSPRSAGTPRSARLDPRAVAGAVAGLLRPSPMPIFLPAGGRAAVRAQSAAERPRSQGAHTLRRSRTHPTDASPAALAGATADACRSAATSPASSCQGSSGTPGTTPMLSRSSSGASSAGPRRRRCASVSAVTKEPRGRASTQAWAEVGAVLEAPARPAPRRFTAAPLLSAARRVATAVAMKSGKASPVLPATDVPSNKRCSTMRSECETACSEGPVSLSEEDGVVAM